MTIDAAEKASLLKEWIKCKKAENSAKEKRLAVEEKVIALYGTDFDGISKTFQEDDYKVGIKKNTSYSIDQEKWISVRESISPDLRPEKIKFDLDIKGFKFLAESDQHRDVYLKVSDCVTIKENKPSITIDKK